MQSQAKDNSWRETELSRLAKAVRFAIGLVLFVLGAFFVLHPTAQVTQSWIGWIVSIALILVGLYEVMLVFRQRLVWNDDGIFVRGVFGNAGLRQWHDLEALSDSMQNRATVLSFKRFRRVKLYWSYQAYREILEIAERKVKMNARTP